MVILMYTTDRYCQSFRFVPVDVSESIAETEKLVAKGVDFLKAYEMLSPEQFEAIAAIAARKSSFGRSCST